MTQSVEYNRQLTYLPSLAHRQQQQLLAAFWMIALGLLIYELFLPENKSLESNFAAILITAAALLPSYLWCSGRAQGMPIFPLFALTYIWTHAFPLNSNYTRILSYSIESRLFASITTAGFLLIGTLTWYQFVKSPPKIPKYYRTLNSKTSNRFFLITMLLAVLFNTVNSSGWLSLDGGSFAIIRGTILALNVIAVFILSYKLGTYELSKSQSRLYIFLLIGYIITNSVSLLLVNAASTFLVAVMAFIIGRKKIPLILILIVVICFSVLHYGKGDMRAKYWSKEQITVVQPWDYPAFYSEWTGYAFDYINKRDNISKKQQKESLAERSSLVQMLLTTQTKAPEIKPFLYGETYKFIPELLIPRILEPNKISSHEGTILLSIHYGLQTRKSNYLISWGLLAESYANFGIFGCGMLAVILGIFYGKVAKWSINAPIISAQSLFAVLIMTFALQTEFTAAVYAAALSQSVVALVGIVLVLMKNYSAQRFPVLNR
ncbi:hypothetical protein NIES2101_00095 [Calothrix sp. HK-06]|nr:hypothetical protein NIES2101_00095 [Calothrix sp. HK-06]